MDELERPDNRLNNPEDGLDPAVVNLQPNELRNGSGSPPSSPSVENHRLIGGAYSRSVSVSTDYSSAFDYESTASFSRSPTPEPVENPLVPAPEPGANIEAPVPEPGPNVEVPVPEPGPNVEVPVPEPGANVEALVPETGANVEAPVPEPRANHEAPAPMLEEIPLDPAPLPEENLEEPERSPSRSTVGTSPSDSPSPTPERIVSRSNSLRDSSSRTPSSSPEREVRYRMPSPRVAENRRGPPRRPLPYDENNRPPVRRVRRREQVYNFPQQHFPPAHLLRYGEAPVSFMLRMEGLSRKTLKRQGLLHQGFSPRRAPRLPRPPPPPPPKPSFNIRPVPVQRNRDVVTTPRELKREGLRKLSVTQTTDDVPSKSKDQIYLEKLAKKFATRANYMPPKHPTYQKMVITTLKAIDCKRGATKDVIMRYIRANFYMGNTNTKIETYLCAAIKSLVQTKRIIPSKAKGFRGCFRLASARVLKRKIRPKAKVVRKAAKVVEVPLSDPQTPKRLPTYEKMIIQTLKGLEKRENPGCDVKGFIKYFQCYYLANANANRMKQYCQKALNKLMDNSYVLHNTVNDTYMLTTHGREKYKKEAYLEVHLFASELVIDGLSRIHYQISSEVERARSRLRDYICNKQALRERADGRVLDV
ncbi:unnamed protein product [Auanema sp. JU1783]|nr:unnamed protein product [Auanema sp. JU1783]